MVSIGGGGGSKQKTSSKPVDLTPAEYTALRPIISNALLSLLLTGGPAFGQATTAFPAGAPATSTPAISAPAVRSPSTAPGGAQPLTLTQRLNNAGLYTGVHRDQRDIGGLTPQAPATAAPAAAPAAPATLSDLIAQFGPQAATQNQPSDFVAALRPEEQQILDALMGQIDNPLFAQGQEMLASTIRGDFLRPESNPFLSAVIDLEQRRLGEAFRDVEAPALQSRFTLAGQNIQPQGSSAFDTAAAIALRGLSNSQADIASRLAGENFQRERGRQLEAVQLGADVSAQEVERLTGILQQQALPRLIEQHGIDKGLEEFRRRMEVILAALGIGAEISSPTVANKSKGSGSSSEGFEFGIGA